LSDTGSATAGGMAAALMLATSRLLASTGRPEFGHGALRCRRTRLRCKGQLSQVPPRACVTNRVRANDPSADLWLGRTSTVHRSLADSTVGPYTFASESANQTGPAGSRDCACAWTRSPRSRHLTAPQPPLPIKPGPLRVGEATWLRFPTCAGAGASSQPDRSSTQRRPQAAAQKPGRPVPSRPDRTKPPHIHTCSRGSTRAPAAAGALVLDVAASELATERQ
jgi:hypothetical protein